MQRHHRQQRRQVIRARRNVDHVVGDLRQVAAAFRADGDHRTLPRLDLLDAVDVAVVHRVVRRDEHARHVRFHQRDEPMFEFGARVAFALDVGDFLHLQRAFQRDGIVVLPPHEKHPLGPGVLRGDFPDVVALFEHAFDQGGDRLEFLDDLQPVAARQVPDTPEGQRDEGEDRQLRGEGFRRRHPDLGSGVHVDARAALARDGARHVVANAQRAVALAQALAHRGEGVDGLAALADGENQRVLVHRHVAVAELARVLHLARQVRQGFDEIFADQPGMVCRAAARDDDAVHLAQFLRGHVDAAQPRARVLGREASAQRIAHGMGLLEDFLEHVVGVVAQLHVVAGEVHLRHLVAARDAALQRADLEAVALDHGHVVVLQVDGLLRMRDDRLRIAGQEVLALAQPDRQRTAAPRADEHVGHVEVHHRDAVGADHLLERRARGFQQPCLGVRAAGLVVELADEVGQDLGVGLRAKLMPRLHERRAEHLVVFDDAVVHERQPAGLVEVRVRVGIVGLAVGGPARVGDADLAGRFVLLQQIRERLDAALALAGLDQAAVDGGQPGGVVAAVFEPPQAVEEDGGRGGLADVADDSAHKCVHRRVNGRGKQGGGQPPLLTARA